MSSKRKLAQASKRVLVRWSDDLDKQVLLCIQYACNDAGLRIPWEKVAELMGEKFSEGAIVQHLAKLRAKMVELNMKVPPPLKRGVVNIPSKIYAGGNKGPPPTASNAQTDQSNATKSKARTKKAKGKFRAFKEGSDVEETPEPAYHPDEDESGSEYGAAKKKRRLASIREKARKAHEAAQIKESQKGAIATDTQRGKVDTFALGANEQDVKEGIETNPRTVRTRGIVRDYAKLEKGDDMEDEYDEQLDEEDMDDKGDDDEVTTKSDFKLGEASPRTVAQAEIAAARAAFQPRLIPPESPPDFSRLANPFPKMATPFSDFSDLPQMNNFGEILQMNQPISMLAPYQTYPVPMMYRESQPSSFSTDRNGSISSLPSQSQTPQYSYSNRIAFDDMFNYSTGNQPDMDLGFGMEFTSPFATAPEDEKNEMGDLEL